MATFIRLPGLGPKTARKLWQELGITTVADLRGAAEAQELRKVAGVGAKLEERILEELAKPKAAEEPYRALLGNALPKLRAVEAEVAAHPAAERVSLAGSARRFRETVRDLDLIATATDARALLDAFCSFPWVVEVAAKGDTKATVVAHDGLRYDLRVVPPESYGNLLQHFTGSKDHNVALREAAVRRGLSVSEYGIAEVETGEVHSFETEEEVYAFLGYGWIRPSCARTAASSTWRATARCRGSSSFATCAATCTRTRRGRTARTRSTRWSAARSRRATTTPSATTRKGCATSGSSNSTRPLTRSTRKCRSRS